MCVMVVYSANGGNVSSSHSDGRQVYGISSPDWRDFHVVSKHAGQWPKLTARSGVKSQVMLATKGTNLGKPE